MWLLPVGVGVAALFIGTGIGAASNPSKTKTVAGPTTVVTQTVTQSAAPAVTVQHTVVKTVQPTVKVTVTYTPPPVATTGDGQYLVGTEIIPGLWHTSGTSDSGSCYWDRESDLSGSISSINANDNISGPTTIQIFASDKAVKFNGGCSWSKTG